MSAPALINFFSCEEGQSLEGGVHFGRATLSDNYGRPAITTKHVIQKAVIFI